MRLFSFYFFCHLEEIVPIVLVAVRRTAPAVVVEEQRDGFRVAGVDVQRYVETVVACDLHNIERGFSSILPFPSQGRRAQSACYEIHLQIIIYN